jgi:hypothetical protein
MRARRELNPTAENQKRGDAGEASTKDIEAERILEDGEYIWSDWHKGYVRARRKGQPLADYRRNEPDSISLEELDDNGLTDPLAMRRDALEWLAERIKQGG